MYDETDRLKYRIRNLEDTLGYAEQKIEKLKVEARRNTHEYCASYDDLEAAIADLKEELNQKVNRMFRAIARELRELRYRKHYHAYLQEYGYTDKPLEW